MAKRKKNKQFSPSPNTYLDLLAPALKEEITGRRVAASLAPEEKQLLMQEYRIRSTPICWGIPMDELMFSKWFVNFTRMSFMPWDGIITSESTYLPDARNYIHNTFRSDSDMPYLMMLDSDVLPPGNVVEMLMAHGKHIVGGWYRNKNMRKSLDHHPIVYDFYSESDKELNWTHRKEPGRGLEKVDGMGAGCWLMSRELADALGDDPYDMERGTEDLVLCKKIMDLGYDMWVDWDVSCAHMGVFWV